MDVHATRSLERRIVIRTPENLEITYELAGAGKMRAAAYLIDLGVMVCTLTLLQNLVMGVAVALPSAVQIYVFGALGLLAFAGFNAYFIAFELFWGGQSPGKRVVGIRVVKSGGYALRFGDSLIRNLMRAVDFIPVFYATGLTCLLLTPRCQRLGDLVAGTLVVYQKTSDSVWAPQAAVGRTLPDLPAIRPGAVPADVFEVCDEFLRTMSELAPKYRQGIAESLVELVEMTSGVRPDIRQSSEAFLREVIRQSGQTLPAT